MGGADDPISIELPLIVGLRAVPGLYYATKILRRARPDPTRPPRRRMGEASGRWCDGATAVALWLSSDARHLSLSGRMKQKKHLCQLAKGRSSKEGALRASGKDVPASILAAIGEWQCSEAHQDRSSLLAATRPCFT